MQRSSPVQFIAVFDLENTIDSEFMDGENSEPAPKKPHGNDENSEPAPKSNGQNRVKQGLISSSTIIGLISSVGAFISLVGVIAFFLSWLYVDALSRRLHFPFRRYFEILDYVQITPSLVSVFIVTPLIASLVAVANFFRSLALRVGYILSIAVLTTLLYIVFWANDSSPKHLEGEGISRVVCKNLHSDVEGLLIFQLNRYVMVLVLNRPLPMLMQVVAIPQAEVSRIETDLPNAMVLGRLPGEVPAVANPSPTSSTTPEPK